MAINYKGKIYKTQSEQIIENAENIDKIEVKTNTLQTDIDVINTKLENGVGLNEEEVKGIITTETKPKFDDIQTSLDNISGNISTVQGDLIEVEKEIENIYNMKVFKNEIEPNFWNTETKTYTFNNENFKITSEIFVFPKSEANNICNISKYQIFATDIVENGKLIFNYNVLPQETVYFNIYIMDKIGGDINGSK